MTFTERNGISAGEIGFYVPILCIAILLVIRHGFGGWFLLVTFSLLRIIGAGIQLAELKDPNNTNLYIGTAICQNVGFSPLLLTTIGLLRRVQESMVRESRLVKMILLLTSLLVTVSLILGIIGGVDAGNDFTKTGTFTFGSLSKAAVGLFIGTYAIVVLAVIYTSFFVRQIALGEKRLLLVIWLSLPILFLRLLYSCFSSFLTKEAKWNTLTGSANLLLGFEVIPELVVVLLYEAFGLTLGKAVKHEDIPLESRGGIEDQAKHRDIPLESRDEIQDQAPAEAKKSGGILHFLATYTIFGRLISSTYHASQKRQSQR